MWYILFMGLSNLKKLTLIVNTSILFMVFGLMAFFHVIKTQFLSARNPFVNIYFPLIKIKLTINKY